MKNNQTDTFKYKKCINENNLGAKIALYDVMG